MKDSQEHTQMVTARAVFNRDANLMPPKPGDEMSETFQKSRRLPGRNTGTLVPGGRGAAIVASQPRELSIFTRVSVTDNIAGDAHRIVDRVGMGLIWLGGRCLGEMM